MVCGISEEPTAVEIKCDFNGMIKGPYVYILQVVFTSITDFTPALLAKSVVKPLAIIAT